MSTPSSRIAVCARCDRTITISGSWRQQGNFICLVRSDHLDRSPVIVHLCDSCAYADLPMRDITDAIKTALKEAR